MPQPDCNIDFIKSGLKPGLNFRADCKSSFAGVENQVILPDVLAIFRTQKLKNGCKVVL